MINFVIVDDDNTSLLIGKFTIHKFNNEAKVITFTEPEIALDKIAKGFGDYNEDIQTILFLDINMPTMTGWDFLDVFNNFHFKIKKRFLIYILSSSIEDFEKKAIKYPFVTGYLSKPLKLNYLQDIYSSQVPNLINY
ncbi:response regulator [Flavobacterium sp. GT3P67]|uniref:response regulator n=1 Tax=Flavobacterium sp. GT3P67 TaxID=2541722 RepID=UPI001405165F|nr:response regulator [Flavobacterium sp. GT3P67]